MIKEIEIRGCYHTCPFFSVEHGGAMYCGHPYFDGEDPDERYIINHDNSKDGHIPKECPFRKDTLSIDYVMIRKQDKKN